MPDNIVNNNHESRIRKVLFNEVSLMLSVVVVVIGIIFFITKPDAQMQQDINLIQKDIEFILENHMVHLKESIDANTSEIGKQQDIISGINNKLIRVLTILENE